MMANCDPTKCEALPREAFGAEDEVLLRHPSWGGAHVHARRRDLGSVIRRNADLIVEDVTSAQRRANG